MNKISPITEYILKLMEERRPGDNIYQLSKRTGIPRNTLLNRLKKSKGWEQAVLLMRICGDLGITMEEAIIQKRIADPKNEILKKYEKKILELEARNILLEAENKKFKSAIENLKNL